MASDSLIKEQIKNFIKEREGKGYEKGQSQPFWIDLLSKVLGVENPTQFIEFEDHVKIDKANGFIDGFIPSTKVLIEQKGINRNLREPIKQSDGSLLNPFQQAKRYSAELPYDKRPRWIITCNFQSFLVYDMNNPNAEPEEILLKNLAKEYYRLSFIVNEKAEHIKKEEEISFKAGELIGKIYDAFAKQYKDLDNEESHKSLNELCVRLVFCLYAEDAEIFGKKDMFHDYLVKYSNDLDAMRKSLIELFKILDTKDQDRDQYLSDELAQFPYVNGGLFSNENIEIPKFTEEIRDLILNEASDGFDWSEISPTIFGAVFESTLNPETRRSGGMHYTSIENIHKVIDPLFLNDLKKDLENCKKEIDDEVKLSTKLATAAEFQEKLSKLKFFDPACGSGNFLTETYLSLRRLENDLISHVGKLQKTIINPINVQINQFYGIEINDFAVSVARTALWIAESQMMNETESILGRPLDFLPLKSYTNIKHGNALTTNWNEVISNKECDYIMGNPPFVGSSMTDNKNTQKEDMKNLFSDVAGYGKLDYVSAWYKKSAIYIQNTKIQCAFVSTNSITQGEQVSLLRKPLFENYNIEINYAYKSFVWTSESSKKAGVVCVIIGFSLKNVVKEKKLYFNGQEKIVKHINGYLSESDDFYIKSRKEIFSNILPKIIQGNKPWDGGNLILTTEEREYLIRKYPNTNNFIKLFIGSNELINNKKRYCLWLKGINPSEYRKIPEIIGRLKAVSEVRLKTKTLAVQKQAEIPMLFSQIRQPNEDYIAIPEVSSNNRKYIPISILDKDIITSNKIFMIPSKNLILFGILISNVHMARMRKVAGRLGNGYSYSPAVYNNFPRPTPTADQKKKIEQTAKAILDARKLYPDSSLADLYDELTMPKELRKAHQENDRAVMEAYGFSTKMTESECVAKLMEMYQELVNEK